MSSARVRGYMAFFKVFVGTYTPVLYMLKLCIKDRMLRSFFILNL